MTRSLGNGRDRSLNRELSSRNNKGNCFVGVEDGSMRQEQSRPFPSLRVIRVQLLPRDYPHQGSVLESNLTSRREQH